MGLMLAEPTEIVFDQLQHDERPELLKLGRPQSPAKRHESQRALDSVFRLFEQFFARHTHDSLQISRLSP